jgi:hypothetical protein
VNDELKMAWRGGEAKKKKACFMIVGIPAEIRTAYLPSTPQLTCTVMIDRFAANMSCFVTGQLSSCREYHEIKSSCMTAFLIPEYCRWPN